MTTEISREWVVLASALVGLVAWGKGSVEWSGIEPHPAVVNPVCGYEPGTVVDLAGEWTFTTGKYSADRSQFFRKMQFLKDWPGARTIHVPGCWQGQGVGDAVPTPGRVCYGGVRNDFPLNHSFVGDGWYRRTVEIPAAWAGKRIWLKIGGVGSQGWFWVNDRQVAHVFDYCATRKFEITSFVKPGEIAKIVAEVTNAGASKLGSAEIYGCWGGLLRTVELEATPDVFIDEAWIRGDFNRHEAEAHVEVVGEGSCVEGMRVRVTVEGETVEQPNNPNHHVVVRIPIGNFRPWSPEHPNLYTGRIELVRGDHVVHARTERFGIRKLEVRGKDFFLNNRPFFVRGVGYHGIDPINGRPPAERESARARVARMREAGFNLVRIHTWCESPEFFEAADEQGLLVQPELPYYGDHPTLLGPFEPLADAEELYLNFRHHPSFAVYSGGNEGTFGLALAARFCREVKARDPDRLVVEQDTDDLDPIPEYDFIGSSPDKSAAARKPFIIREYLNLAIKADSRLEPCFTGAWGRVFRRADREQWLAKFGLTLKDGDRLQDAQHAYQATCQKIGVENARRDPNCDGYHFWSLADCACDNEIGWTGMRDLENPAHMAQGLFNSFLGEKSNGQTAVGFATFNSPSFVGIAAKPADLQLVAGEPFAFDVFLAHYGDAPLATAHVGWRILDGKCVLASGGTEAGRQELGGVRKVAAFAPCAPTVTVPLVATLEVEVGGIRNSWACWIFPRRMPRKGLGLAVSGRCSAAVARMFPDAAVSNGLDSAAVVIVDYGSPEAVDALKRGQNVIEIGGLDGPPNVDLGWWFLKGLVGATFDTAHPVLAYLPPSKDLSTLHRRIFKKGLRLPIKGVDSSSLVAICEEGDGCYTHLVARVDARGGRHLIAYGLALDQDLPESEAILDGLVDYACRPVAAAELGTAHTQESVESGKSQNGASLHGQSIGGVGRD